MDGVRGGERRGGREAARALAVAAWLAAAWLAGGCATETGGPPRVADDTTAGLTATEAITAHDTASRGPRQPIPFNHRFHVGELEMECLYCHTGVEETAVGAMPPLSTCMGCHRVAGGGLPPVEELRAYWERGEAVPWEPVFQLPEFVQFTHRAHLRNSIACERCHGPVGEMDRVYRATSLSMGWCLSCHRSRPEPRDVATNYLLVREFPPPPMPEGDEDPGLYPIPLDENYAEQRAPVDCASCHY